MFRAIRHTHARTVARRSALVAGLAIALGGGAAPAHATLDFEDLDVGNNGLYLGYGFDRWSFESGAWHVAYRPGDFAVVTDNRMQGVLFSGNGSKRMRTANGGAITVTSLDGQPFNATGFEGGETWISLPHYWATAIQVTGFRRDGQTVAETFALDLVKDPLLGMESFALGAGFRGLLALEFRGIGGNPDFSIDNVMLTPVPEPALAWLMLAGLGAGALLRRRGRLGPAGA